MNLKEELLKRIENEVTYEDGFGSKTIKEVIDEVFKEAENKQFVITDVGCSKINVLVSYLVEEEYFKTEYYEKKQVFEVDKLTDLNNLFKDNLIDIKVLN